MWDHLLCAGLSWYVGGGCRSGRVGARGWGAGLCWPCWWALDSAGTASSCRRVKEASFISKHDLAIVLQPSYAFIVLSPCFAFSLTYLVPLSDCFLLLLVLGVPLFSLISPCPPHPLPPYPSSLSSSLSLGFLHGNRFSRAF